MDGCSMWRNFLVSVGDVPAVWVLGFGVWGLGLEVWGVGFGVGGLVCVWGGRA